MALRIAGKYLSQALYMYKKCEYAPFFVVPIY
jgi:hypothetical protein